MPLIGFYCPAGNKVPLEVCLEGKGCTEPCLTLPSLISISEEREWKGVASTTQLINGTMLEFLKLTQPYYVDPDSRAFMLRGTQHHEGLDSVAKKLGLASEVALSVDRDIFDLVEFEGKELVLTDYKLWGSLRVAKALGIVKVGKEPHPTEVYKSTGKWGKAGDPKMIPIFGTDLSKAENWEARLQLNRYRVKLGDLGLKVHRMRAQATVRDGGLGIAESRGVMRNIYLIPIKEIPDDEVKVYFDYKDVCLQQALEDGRWDYPCTPMESWDGIRCERFCDVWDYCPKGRLVHGIGG